MTTSQDLVKGIDITGLETVTGSEINQTVDAGRLAEDKGMRIITTDTAPDVPDVPDPDTELDGVLPIFWYRYKWVRMPYETVTDVQPKEYNWNANIESDATLLKWQWSGEAAALAQATAESASANATAATLAAATASTVAGNALSAATAAATQAEAAEVLAETATSVNVQQSADIAALQASLEQLQDDTGELEVPVPVNKGGTGGTTRSTARAGLGLDYTPVGHVLLRDVKNPGEHGGTFTSGDWRVRTLNTEFGNVETHVILNGDDTFGLSQGTYVLKAKLPAWGCIAHQARLEYYDGASWLAHTYGTSEYSNITDSTQTSSEIIAVISVTALTQFRITHQCSSTSNTTGLGWANSFGGSEIYSLVEIQILSRTPTA